MARPSTLPHKWLTLAEAVGGIPTLQHAIGISKMQLWRIAHGRNKTRTPVRKIVTQLARLHNVADPLEPSRNDRPSPKILEMIGTELTRGIFPTPNTIAHIRTLWPESALIDLAETSECENILRAVTWLLEG